MRHTFLASIAALTLTGCSSIVPSTLARLNLLDPMTADPAGFAVALEMDEGLGIQEGSVVFTVEVTHSPSGEIRGEDLVLVEDRSETGRLVYSISPEGVQALTTMQTELLPWKETSDGNSVLTLTVVADGCLVDKDSIPEDPRVSVFLQLAAEAPMRPLVQNGALTAMFDVDDLAELPQCIG